MKFAMDVSHWLVLTISKPKSASPKKNYAKEWTPSKSSKKSVTCYGSARIQPGTKYYEHARSIGSKIVRELDFAVITGGGPGIMEAANRGAFEAGGDSIGMTIVLPMEQHTNPYVTLEIPFYYFFTRKTTLSFSSRAMVGFPGGFGTYDEIFEVMTLMQTGKMPRRPIILFGSDFWGPLDAVIRQTLITEFATISPEDTNLYTITDDENEVIRIIREYITANPITEKPTA